MATASIYENIVAYLGGEAKLKRVGVRAYDTDTAHVCLKLLHPNPRHVVTVTITACVHDRFRVDCFGRISPESFRAPLIAHAQEVALENLADILGALTGDETLSHHIFGPHGLH